jgi:VCBS repeat-containing protein
MAVLRAEPLEARYLLTASVLQHGPTVEEYNGVGYFLHTDAPQIERYDIANEAWLTPITLTGGIGNPTAQLIDADGIFVAFGQSLNRYNLDGSGQTHLLNGNGGFSAIHSDGNLLFLNYSSGLYARFLSVDKTTGAVIDSIENYVDSVYGSSISPETNRIIGRSAGISPADITYVAYGDNGKFAGGGDSPYHGDFPGASRTWVFPGGAKVVDNAGQVYSTDSLTHLASFGTSITDIAFSGGSVPIVLSGNTLSAYTTSILPAGSITLAGTPADVFVNASDAVTFTADSTKSTGWAATIVPLSSLSAPTPGQPVNPVGLPYKPDDVERAADGTVLLLSKANQSIFRWSPSTQTYGATIPLVGSPDYMAYSATTNTIYLAYHSGLIRQINLGAASPSEVPFATLPGTPLGLATAGKYLFASDPSGAWNTHYVYAPDGTLVQSKDWNYYSREYIWSDANQKMYFFRDDTSPNDLLWEQINASGTAWPGVSPGGIGTEIDSPLHDSAGFSHPIRVSPDGSIVVLGSGLIHDGTTLARQTTGLSNAIADAAWFNGELYTLRAGTTTNTDLQHWSTPTYGLDKDVLLPGTPFALNAISSTRMLVISMSPSNAPLFTLFDQNLAIISPQRQLSLALSASTVAENQPSGTTVGTLSTIDNLGGHSYTYTLVPGNVPNDNAAFTISGGTLKTAKSLDFETQNSYSIRVRTTDEGGVWAESPFTIAVTDVNEAPVATGDTYPATEDTPLSVNASLGVLANDNDPEKSPLTAVLVSGALHGTLTLGADGSFQYVPGVNYSGADRFTYRASDGTLSGNTVTVILNVAPVNDPPSAADDAYTATIGQARTVGAPGVLLNDTDIDGDAIMAVLDSSPSHGTLDLKADGSFVYTPAAGYTGTDSFAYHAADGSTSSPIATVTITINDAAPPPLAVDDQLTTNEDQPLTIPIAALLANDSGPAGTQLTALLALGSGPLHGTLALSASGSSLLYTPAANFSGTDHFAYRAAAGDFVSGLATVYLGVTPVNDPPSFVAGADVHVTDESGPQTIPAWAKSISPGPLEAAQTAHFLVTGDNAALFAAAPAIDPSGQLTFTPQLNATGTAHVVVVLIDDGGTASGGIDFSQPRVFSIVVDKLHPLHNAVSAMDVNGDQFVAPSDALAVINYLNAPLLAQSGLAGGAGEYGPGDYCDVNADDVISPLDALLIINYLNSTSAHGEGEAATSSSPLPPELIDLLAADLATDAEHRRAR